MSFQEESTQSYGSAEMRRVIELKNGQMESDLPVIVPGESLIPRSKIATSVDPVVREITQALTDVSLNSSNARLILAHPAWTGIKIPQLYPCRGT